VSLDVPQLKTRAMKPEFRPVLDDNRRISSLVRLEDSPAGIAAVPVNPGLHEPGDVAMRQTTVLKSNLD